MQGVGLGLMLVLVLRVGRKEYGEGNGNCNRGPEIGSVLGVGRGAWSWNRNKSGGARCKATAGCTAETRARGKAVQVRELNTAFRGTPCNLCFLRLAPAQGSNPKKCDPRLRRHFEGSEPWASTGTGATRRKKGRGKKGEQKDET